MSAQINRASLTREASKAIFQLFRRLTYWLREAENIYRIIEGEMKRLAEYIC